jgi:hypothetical protein
MSKSVPQPKAAAKHMPADCTETQSVADYVVGRYGSIANAIPALLWAILCEIVEVKRCLTKK